MSGALGAATSRPLTARELDVVCGWLAEHSDFDHDGVLGLLHAVSIAPGRPGLGLWLPLLLRSERARSFHRSDRRVVGLLLRQRDDVVAALAAREVIVPEPEETRAWGSFARGYVHGAALDPLWRAQPKAWKLVAPFAFLAGCHDFLPSALCHALKADPGAEDACRSHAAALIGTARERFAVRERLGRSPRVA